jgi:hypothetical protein
MISKADHKIVIRPNLRAEFEQESIDYPLNTENTQIEAQDVKKRKVWRNSCNSNG